MFKFNKEQFILSLKSDLNKTLAPVSKNLPTIMLGGAFLSMCYGAYSMWAAVPKAQEAIETREYELNGSLTKLEAAAVAAPHMIKPLLAFGTAAGLMVGSDYISRSRLAASTALAVAAMTDKKKLEEKLEELVGKEKADQAKKEIFEEQHNAEVLDTKGLSTHPSKENLSELELNKLYRCVLSPYDLEFYATQMSIAGAEFYIQNQYKKTADNQWIGSPFSLNTVVNLFGKSLGPYGDRVGYSFGDDFHIGVYMALDRSTGESFLQVELPTPDPKYEVPFT